MSVGAVLFLFALGFFVGWCWASSRWCGFMVRAFTALERKGSLISDEEIADAFAIEKSPVSWMPQRKEHR